MLDDVFVERRSHKARVADARKEAVNLDDR